VSLKTQRPPVRLLLATATPPSEGINMQEWLPLDHPLRHPLVHRRSSSSGNGRVFPVTAKVRDVYVHYFPLRRGGKTWTSSSKWWQKVEQVREDLGRRGTHLRRRHSAAPSRGKQTSVEESALFVQQEIARSPERIELGHARGHGDCRPDQAGDGVARKHRCPPRHLPAGPRGDPPSCPSRLRARGRWRRSPAARISTASSRPPGGRGPGPGRRCSP